MTNNHPINPPPVLRRLWFDEGQRKHISNLPDWIEYIAEKSAQWGADQQLAKDAEWLNHNALNEPHLRITPVGQSLKEAMRPKPPSLEEEALDSLQKIEDNNATYLDADIIRRALKALPE